MTLIKENSINNTFDRLVNRGASSKMILGSFAAQARACSVLSVPARDFMMILPTSVGPGEGDLVDISAHSTSRDPVCPAPVTNVGRRHPANRQSRQSSANFKSRQRCGYQPA
ncbi:MAG: hypothetical protein U5J95_03320 [Balneolaceae bacterium]|nr:hypothetical protein [Balneolaceae bacterium]